MSPVYKSVNARPLKRIWNGVLAKVFFQIAAKISEFPATATGDKTAIMMEIEKETAQVKESFKPQGVEKLWLREEVVLLIMV